MKISLSWVFDHIDGNWRDVDVSQLVSIFNRKTAEIECVHQWSWKVENFAIAVVVQVRDDSIRVTVPEWGVNSELEKRDGFDQRDVGFLVCREGNRTRWATYADFGVGDREELITPFKILSNELNGEWKKDLEKEDIIFEVDNKSITNRPDMWGHRGFAREIAMLLDLPFKSENSLVEDLEVKEHGNRCSIHSGVTFGIQNSAFKACSRFCGAYFENVVQAPAITFIALRLLRIGSKSINSIVDLTNYLMFDWGQPVHAYDAGQVDGNQFVIRMASKGERLELLDGSVLELTNDDLVIASNKKPMALAGVMGGKASSVGKKTTKIFLESAMFDATTVRRSALSHKIRTEASARFEKSPTPVQASTAIKRFVSLAKRFEIAFDLIGPVNAVGTLPEKVVLEISHIFLESHAGVQLSVGDVATMLKKLEFEIAVQERNGEKWYQVAVPPFRASKDISIKEDILEEVVRCYGLDRIPQALPAIRTGGVDLRSRFKLRSCRHHLSHGAGMMEQYNYSFIDESFAKKIGYDPEKTLNLLNPVSDQARRLTTTLMPGLLKNIFDNYSHSDGLAFFESARRWIKKDDDFEEQQMIAGVAFNKRGGVDFYEWKTHIAELFCIAELDSVCWEKAIKPPYSWMHPYQTAQIIVDDVVVGFAGKVDAKLWSLLDFLSESDAFLFEIDAKVLSENIPEFVRYKPISKYQESNFDLSFMVPVDLTTNVIESLIRDSNKFITDVELVDFFEKKEWGSKRSLAFRIACGSNNGTLSKDEVENIRLGAIKVVEECGAELRSK